MTTAPAGRWTFNPCFFRTFGFPSLWKSLFLKIKAAVLPVNVKAGIMNPNNENEAARNMIIHEGMM
jgi:hypothetical protein